jgi:gas vesicle protein
MTPAEMAIWVGIVTGIAGVIGGFLTALKFAGTLGGEKSKFEGKISTLMTDVAELKAHRPFCVTTKECEHEHAEFKKAITQQIDIQVQNGLGEVKEQLSDINGTLCYFMGQMNVQPPPVNQKRRRQQDQSPSVL